MAIVLNRISFGYGTDPILAEIDLTIADGEIVVILGPSGCGKTTLLRLIGGMERPDVGTVGVGPRGPDSRICHVFQDAALLPWRTAAGNVALAIERRGVPARERRVRVAEALARVGLASFAEHYPKALSGGMRQRVGIARALVARPDVLLMDEPMASLDELSRDRLLDDLAALWTAAPFTCVYVTHSLFEAVHVGHRVVVLSDRPARVVGIVPVTAPLGERRGTPAVRKATDRIRALAASRGAAGDLAVARS